MVGKAPTKPSKPKPKPRSSSSGSRGSGGGGGGGGGGGIKKTNDKYLADQLERLLGKDGFAKARDTVIKNQETVAANDKALLLERYNDLAGQLGLSRLDTEKSEVDQSYANLANRARETGEALAQATEHGVGETDVARSMLMAAQNWDANQGEINRSYFDSIRAVNNEITGLNADTKAGLMNIDKTRREGIGQAWANYYNQRAETAAQLANIYANPYSTASSKTKAKNAAKKMADASSAAWTDPGASQALKNWQGSEQPKEGNLNNDLLGNANRPKPPKKPEGSTLQVWEG